MAETYNQDLDVVKAATERGMPPTELSDTRFAAGRAAFSEELTRDTMYADEFRAIYGPSPIDTPRKHGVKRRHVILAGLATVGAVVGTPQGRELAGDVANAVNEHINNDEMSDYGKHGDQDTPPAAVQHWDKDPTKTVITVQSQPQS